MTPVLLSIDIDGVLHGSDAHFALANVRATSPQELHAAGLFAHRALLADVLAEHPYAKLVCHSSWRRDHDLGRLRALLGPAGERLLAVAPLRFEREKGVEALMTRWRMRRERVVIIDDMGQLFARLRDRVVVCQASVGLPSAVDELHEALRRAHAAH